MCVVDFCATSMVKGVEERGVEHVALLETYVRAYNKIVDDRPANMNAGLHLCRGNSKNGMHFSKGGYDRIARCDWKSTSTVTTSSRARAPSSR